MGLSNTIQKWSSQRAGRNRLHPCACRRRAVRRERACSGASVMTRTVVRGAAPYSGARQPSRRSAANVEAALTLLDKKTLSTFDAVGDLVRRPPRQACRRSHLPWWICAPLTSCCLRAATHRRSARRALAAPVLLYTKIIGSDDIAVISSRNRDLRSLKLDLQVTLVC